MGGDQLHIGTEGGDGVKVLAGAATGKFVQYAGLGAEHELAGGAAFGIGDDLGGAADKIGCGAHFRRAFGMGQHEGIGMGELFALHVGGEQLRVHGAVPARKIEMLAGHMFFDEAPQIFIGDKEDVLIGEGRYDLDRVRRGDAHVGSGLELRRGIDVADDGEVLYFPSQRLDLPDVRHVRHGAVGCGFGEKHPPPGVENFGAFAHEAHAAEDDGLLLLFGGDLCQVKRIAHVVCQRLHGAVYIVMGENDCVFALFQRTYLFGDHSLPACSFADTIHQKLTAVKTFSKIYKFLPKCKKRAENVFRTLFPFWNGRRAVEWVSSSCHFDHFQRRNNRD